MKQFLGDDFLLNSNVAEELYHDFAKQMPIIDYHNHLPPEDIAKDRHFTDITEAWLAGDHYKWRAMRAFGVDESYITGDQPSQLKFQKWSEVVPYTIRNPLYHWTHLELRRYFNINDILSPDTADSIYDQTKEALSDKDKGCQGLLEMMNVELLCTTDDPTDDLRYHQQIAASNLRVKVLPTFRPDKALTFESAKAFKEYLHKLEAIAGQQVSNLEEYLSLLESRIDFFHDNGCRLADVSFGSLPQLLDNQKVDKHFEVLLAGGKLEPIEMESLQAYLLLELCKMYHARGWAQQFHLGVLRNNNERAYRELGPDTGFDSMGDFSHAVTLSRFLSRLDNTDQLARTILYNLNPRDNDLFATMAGNYQDGKIRGKIQFGTGWWFLDQKMGMEAQINSLSNMGLLSCFVGMLTDSRSFLSFPRHEYFRRVLCNLIGRDVHNGELPHDVPFLGAIVKDICYHNAKNYFRFE